MTGTACIVEECHVWIRELCCADGTTRQQAMCVRRTGPLAVALDARVINNIVVRSIADELLEQIDEEVPDEPEVPLA